MRLSGRRGWSLLLVQLICACILCANLTAALNCFFCAVDSTRLQAKELDCNRQKNCTGQLCMTVQYNGDSMMTFCMNGTYEEKTNALSDPKEDINYAFCWRNLNDEILCYCKTDFCNEITQLKNGSLKPAHNLKMLRSNPFLIENGYEDDDPPIQKDDRLRKAISVSDSVIDANDLVPLNFSEYEDMLHGTGATLKTTDKPNGALGVLLGRSTLTHICVALFAFTTMKLVIGVMDGFTSTFS